MKFIITSNNPDAQERIMRKLQKEFRGSEFVQVIRRKDFNEAINRGDFDLVLTDYRLNWADGLWVLRIIKERFPHIPVVMVTDTGSEEIAVEGMKAGLSDYVLKGHMHRLTVAVKESLEKARLRKEYEDAIRQLRISEERYRVVSELTSDYAYAFRVEPDGTLVREWTTEAFARITGHTLEDVDASGGWQSVIHPDDIPIALQHRDRLLSGQPAVSEFRIITKGREVRWLRDAGRPVVDQARGRVVRIYGAARDITERKRAEEALRENETSICGLYKIASAQQLSFAKKVQALLTMGCQRFGLDIGILSHIEGERYEVIEAQSPRNVIPKGAIFELRSTYCREVIAANGPVGFEHATASGWRNHPAYAASKLESYLGTPVIVAGQVYGTLNFSSLTPHAQPFKTADKELLNLMAQCMGGEIEREQRTRETTLLSEIGDLLQTCLTAEEAHTVIAQSAQQLFPAQVGALFVINASRNLVEAVAVWGASPAGPGERVFAVDDCWALRRARVHWVEDTRPGLLCKHLPRPLPAAYLCMPMMAQGEILGVLHLSQPDAAQGRLTEAKQWLAETVAEHIALALANLKLRETLHNQSTRDSLTGLYNRRYLVETLKREVRRAERRHCPLGIIMLDLDYFKRFNDAFGHEAGDTLLRELGDLLQKHIRGEDVACRYGGDEFTLILPGASLDATRQRAERLQEAVKHLHVQHRGQSLGPITLSLGVVIFPDHGSTVETILRAADAALYRAKQEGRNRAVLGQ